MTAKKIIICAILILTHSIKAESESSIKTELPFTYGPGPLFSYALNLQPKKTLIYRQIYETTERDLTTELLLHNHFYYGITDRATLIFKQPVLLKRRVDGVHARGLGNFRLELEAEPYVYDVPKEFRFRIITVTGFVSPSTTVKQTTENTLHSPGYFLYVSQSSITPEYFQYAGIGTLIPTTHKGLRLGTVLYYEIGICHTIIYTDKFYLGITFESSGEYRQPQTRNKIPDYPTGSFMIYYGPTLRFTTKHFIGQIGIQYPWVKHLKETPTNPINYRFAMAGAFRYTF